MRVPKILSIFSISILLVGILVRIVVYLQNRSLFIDEANLARNFVEKSYPEFFSPLSYYQYSPPLFSFIEKSQIQLWGVHEYALRLFPFFCSILSLYLFYLLCERLIDQIYLRWFPLWLVAFSGWFIRYGTEVKQYSSDILLGALLPYLALRERVLPHWVWAIIGIISVWISMSSVFFLAGIGLWLLIKNWLNVNSIGSTHRHPPPPLERGNSDGGFSWQLVMNKEFWRWMLVIGIWLVNFVIYYFLVLRPNVTSSDLQSYHNGYFLPLIPTNSADFILIKNLFLSIIKTGYGFTIPAYIIGIGGISLFCYYSVKNIFLFLSCSTPNFNSKNGSHSLFEEGQGDVKIEEKNLLLHPPSPLDRENGSGNLNEYLSLKSSNFFISLILLFGVPILLCLFASMLHFYSLIPRLTLFFIPALILLSTLGWVYFYKKTNRYGKVFVLLFFVMTTGLQTGFRYLWQPLEIEEIKTLLEVLKVEKQAADYIYVFNESEGPYQFYTTQHIDNQLLKFNNVHIAKWNENPDRLLKQRNPQRMWLLYTHLLSAISTEAMEKDLESIKSEGNIKLIKDSKGGKLFLYKKKSLAPMDGTSDFRQR